MRATTPWILVLAVLVSGCESYYGRPSSYEGSFGVTYRETMHDGRVYVIGKSSTWKAWEKKPGDLAYSRTLIGEGPAGETVVIEADPKDASVDQTLTDLYFAKHFYAEASHDGRLYVFGHSKTQDAFAQSPSVAYCRTFIGEGPGGVTLVVEVDPKNAELENRLIAEVQRRHGLKLN